MGELRIRTIQPDNPDYEYTTTLEVLDLEKERARGLSHGRDFIITEPQGIKKDVKSDSSIFSSKYGESVLDQDAYKDRYRCSCGHLRGALYNGEECPTCKTRVKYVDDDFSIFGWIVLQHGYKLIHPNLFEVLKSFIGGKVLSSIIKYTIEADEDGFVKDKVVKETSPFAGIGMIEFAQRLDEILEFYRKKNKSNQKKMELYQHLINNREKILTDSIPVYTLFLRMANVSGDQFSFTKNNKWYNNLALNMGLINDQSTSVNRRKKNKNEILEDMQLTLQEVYKTIIDDMKGKMGAVRSVMAGRFNFTARAVIVPDETLRVDEIRLPYAALVVLMEQTLINYMVKTLDMSYSDAHKRWFKAQITRDEFVVKTLNEIIRSSDNKRGISFMINRNPSINYGSVLHMYCIGINDNFTMSMPLQVLKPLAADFDGDCMNITYIINKEFESALENSMNPRNAMMISKNDGMFNQSLNHIKDTYVNLAALVTSGRDSYTKEELEEIEALKSL